MSRDDKNLIQQIASWPEADQQEIAAIAREIESRRTGIYRLSDAERAAVALANILSLKHRNENLQVSCVSGMAPFWLRNRADRGQKITINSTNEASTTS
jgi:hypothetical protein